MSGPLAIEVTLGGLFNDLPALVSKPRVGAKKASLLSKPSGSRTQRKHRKITEHDVASVVSGSP
jgi:hypothetical protein